MEFQAPSANGFTVYSKSKCDHCVQLKEHLKSKHLLFQEVVCDDYLTLNRDDFLSFLQERTQGRKHTTFPMVFYNGFFVGGREDTEKYVGAMLLSFDELF